MGRNNQRVNRSITTSSLLQYIILFTRETEKKIYIYIIMNKVLGKKTLNKIMAVILGLSIIIVIGLRHPSMGTDLGYGGEYGYLSSYENLSELGWLYVLRNPYLNYEIGYRVFNKILGMLGLDIQSFLIVCAVLSVVPISCLVFNYSKSSITSYIIYMGLPVFQLLYSGLRQDIAIGLCVFSLIFVINRKIIPFIAVVLVACTFHSSAIIFFISYPLYYLKFSKFQRMLSCVFLILVYILKRPLFAVLSRLFKDNAAIDDNGAIVLFVVFVVIYIFCTIYNDESELQSGFLNLFYLACLCQAFGDLYSIALRVGYYFMITLVVLLPNLLKTMPKSKEKLYSNIFVPIAFFSFGLYSIYSSSWSMAYPYHWFWESV